MYKDLIFVYKQQQQPSRGKQLDESATLKEKIEMSLTYLGTFVTYSNLRGYVDGTDKGFGIRWLERFI